MARIGKYRKLIRDVKRGDLVIFGGKIYRVYTNSISPDHSKLNDLTLIDDSLRSASASDLVIIEIPADIELEVMRLED